MNNPTSPGQHPHDADLEPVNRTDLEKTSKRQECSVDGCSREAIARGWCTSHYARWHRHGSPTHKPGSRAGDPVKRFWERVRKSDGCWEWTGTRSNGYGILGVQKKNIPAHRMSYELNVGQIPEGMVIDHRCHNTGCVRPSHLRPVTIRQNVENRAGAQRNNKSSGVRGVTRCKRSGLWIAQAKHMGKNHHGGRFATIEEAAEAARQLRLRLFTHSDMDKRSA